MSAHPSWTAALIVTAVAAMIRLALAAAIPVFPDETYYWEWSRRLAPGYFDHPPAIALLIRAGGILLEPVGAAASSIGVRFGAVLAGFVAALGTAMIARRLAGDGAALRAAVVIACVPLAAAGLLIATPDAPLLAFAALTLYTLTRALQSEPRSRASTIWWAATGLALGGAFCSKYTSIVLPLGVLLAVLSRRELRVRLREPGPYVACVIATIVFIPVLVWNARHDWVSFAYQIEHGLGESSGSAAIAAVKREGDYIGGQAAVASPILFVLLAVAVARGLRKSAPPVAFVLAMVAAVTFVFFAYSAVRKHVEPNWPAPAYIPAIVLLSTAQWKERGERWLRWGIGLAAAISLLIYIQGITPILPIAPRRDPIARAFGWRELTREVERAMQSATTATGARTWAGADRYQEASEIAFHSEDHAPTFAFNLAGRPNQYDLWPRFQERAADGDNLVLVLDESETQHPALVTLGPQFRTMERGALVSLRRAGAKVGERRVWVLSGFQRARARRGVLGF